MKLLPPMSTVYQQLILLSLVRTDIIPFSKGLRKNQAFIMCKINTVTFLFLGRLDYLANLWHMFLLIHLDTEPVKPYAMLDLIYRALSSVFFFSFSFPFVFGKYLNSLLTVQTQSLGLFSTKYYFHLFLKFQNILQGVYNTLTCRWLSIPMDNETDKTKVMLINLFPENSYVGVPMRQIVRQPREEC